MLLIAAAADFRVEESASSEVDNELVREANDGDLERCRELILSGTASVNAVGSDGCTAMYMACEGQHVKLVKMLVECGADVDHPIHDGATPIFIAAYYRGPGRKLRRRPSSDPRPFELRLRPGISSAPRAIRFEKANSAGTAATSTSSSSWSRRTPTWKPRIPKGTPRFSSAASTAASTSPRAC